MSDAILTLPRSGKRLAVYLINMDGAEARLAAMRDRLAAVGLPFQRIAGVDGRLIAFPIPDFSACGYRLLHGRRTTPPEVGCYLSHIAATRAFLDSRADLALILEDDVAFSDGFVDTLDRAACQSAGMWNILRLSSVNHGRKFPVRDLGNGHALALALTREKGAGAYVIDRAAAHWFVTRLLPMRLAWDIAFDLEYLAGLRACFVEPMPADQVTGAPTQIQAGLSVYKLPLWRYFTVLPYRSYLEITRLVMRGGRLLAAKLRGGS